MPSKSLSILDTDPLALMALGFLVLVIVATLALFGFIMTRKSAKS